MEKHGKYSFIRTDKNFLWLVFCLLAVIQANYIQASEKASCDCFDYKFLKDAIRKKCSLPYSEFQFSLNPSLAESLFYLQNEDFNEITVESVPKVCFFDVTNQFFEAKGDTFTQTIILDFKPEPIVAFDLRTSQVFVLDCGDNSVGEYNKFLEGLKVLVDQPEKAIRWFRFYIAATSPKTLPRIIPSEELILLSAAAKDFSNRLLKRPEGKTFLKLWKRMIPAARTRLYRPKAFPDGDGFIIRYWEYSMGVLYERELNMASDGTVHEHMFINKFPLLSKIGIED